MSVPARGLFIAVSVIWGVPYLFIKVAVDEGIPAGVVALVGLDLTGGADELLGALVLLVAALGYAAAPLLVLKRHLADLDPRVSTGVSLAIGAVVLAPAAALDPPEAPRPDRPALTPAAIEAT